MIDESRDFVFSQRAKGFDAFEAEEFVDADFAELLPVVAVGRSADVDASVGELVGGLEVGPV